MYKSLRIRNFRCHEDTEIGNLGRINLVAGKNNVGKSTLLEALFVLCGAHNPAPAIGADARRGLDRIEIGGEPPWASLFCRYDTRQPIRIEGAMADAPSQVVTLRSVSSSEELSELVRSLGSVPTETSSERQPLMVYAAFVLESRRNGSEMTAYTLLRSDGLRPIPEALPPPPFPAHIISARTRAGLEEDADLFSKLQIAGKEDGLLNGLRAIEPSLESLSLQRIAGQTIIHGRLPGLRLMPIPLMGEGMQRLCTLLLRIAHSSRGVVLVDEIENGFHHTVLPDVWRAIGRTSTEVGVQVFATTHSAECIEAATLAFAEEPGVFLQHRLDRIAGRTQAVTYDRETLDASIAMGLEVR